MQKKAWQTKKKHRTLQDVLGMHMIAYVNPMIFFSILAKLGVLTSKKSQYTQSFPFNLEENSLN